MIIVLMAGIVLANIYLYLKDYKAILIKDTLVTNKQNNEYLDAVKLANAKPKRKRINKTKAKRKVKK